MNQGTASEYGVRQATHDFVGVVVLRNVDYGLRGGRVHALIGENGSGKSTLTKILTGAVKPSAGEIRLNGQRLDLASPADATEAGIGVVHQDYNLFPALTVADTVMALHPAPPRWRRTPFLNQKMVRLRTKQVLEGLGVEISGGALVGRLGTAERKFIEIARAMVTEPQFLILDEPTASLGPSEAARVLELIERLRDRGVGVGFVSHRLDEVSQIADDVTVLRDGVVVGTARGETLSEGEMARLMLGRPAEQAASEMKGPQFGRELLRVATPTSSGSPELAAREGEIIALTGLVGSGAAEVVRMLGGMGERPGSVVVDGERQATIRSPRDATRLGIGFIPEDRKGSGLVPELSVAMNISLASLGGISRRGVLSRRRATDRAERYQSLVDIRSRSVEEPVKVLSGGNQQKVLIARWLASGVRILAIEEPTHGVDIGAKSQIHRLLHDFVGKGGVIVLATTDVREALELAHRVGVFRHGELVFLAPPGELTESDLTLIGVTNTESMLKTLRKHDAVSGSYPLPNRAETQAR